MSLLNTLLLSITMSFNTSLFWKLGCKKSNINSELELIGFVNGYMISLGIICGSFIAFIFSNSDKW